MAQLLSTSVTGSLVVTQNITASNISASFFGTSSWSNNATSALTASSINFSIISSSYANTSVSASYIYGTGSINTYCVSAPITWTNQPVALTEYPSSTRCLVDFSKVKQVKTNTYVTTIGNAAARLWLQANSNADASTGWIDIFPSASAISLSQTGSKVLDWISLTGSISAQELYVRCVGQGGNAALDPVIAMWYFMTMN